MSDILTKQSTGTYKSNYKGHLNHLKIEALSSYTSNRCKYSEVSQVRTLKISNLTIIFRKFLEEITEKLKMVSPISYVTV